MQQPVDILILSNGPGELATWVKPVLQELRQQLGTDRSQVRISVVLSPCANASGREAAIAESYPEVDRVQAANHFFPFLLWGKTQNNWDWRSQGVVVFLGGDQFFPVVIGKRLGYKTVVYAEWEARWHRWVDYFGVMNGDVLKQVSPALLRKFTIIGDLMAEAGKQADFQEPVEALEPGVESRESPSAPLIGLLPGSKPMKLTLGLPLMLAIAEEIAQTLPQIRFAIPVAPALPLVDLLGYADPERNPMIQKFGWGRAELVTPPAPQPSYLKTNRGVQIELWQEFPAYQSLRQCSLCLTTVGANTAELGALTVPMIVLLPTQQLDVMRAWDGLPGMLVNLPGVGALLARWINQAFLRQGRLLAWPNIWAGEEIVPELVGELEPQTIAQRVLTYLQEPATLEAMRSRLRQARGAPGAAYKLVQLVQQALA